MIHRKLQVNSMLNTQMVITYTKIDLLYDILK